MAIVLKNFNPEIKIYAVQQSNAPFMAEWFKSGKYPADATINSSIAEGVGAEVEEVNRPGFAGDL